MQTSTPTGEWVERAEKMLKLAAANLRVQAEQLYQMARSADDYERARLRVIASNLEDQALNLDRTAAPF